MLIPDPLYDNEPMGLMVWLSGAGETYTVGQYYFVEVRPAMP